MRNFRAFGDNDHYRKYFLELPQLKKLSTLNGLKAIFEQIRFESVGSIFFKNWKSHLYL